MNYQSLFDLMANEHGLMLTNSEMDEIVREARKVAGDDAAQMWCAHCTPLTLYLLTCELGDYYVAATDPTEAVRLLTETLDRADYGYYEKRKVTNIKVLSKQITERNGKPWVSDEHRLIIQL